MHGIAPLGDVTLEPNHVHVVRHAHNSHSLGYSARDFARPVRIAGVSLLTAGHYQVISRSLAHFELLGAHGFVDAVEEVYREVGAPVDAVNLPGERPEAHLVGRPHRLVVLIG